MQGVCFLLSQVGGVTSAKHGKHFSRWDLCCFSLLEERVSFQGPVTTAVSPKALDSHRWRGRDGDMHQQCPPLSGEELYESHLACPKT